MRLRSSSLRLLTLAAVVLAVLPAVAGAAPGGDSTSGNTVIFGTTRLDWSARSTATGFNARGNARYTVTGTDPNQVYSGDVTCLRVVGATATTPALVSIGVLLTQTPPGSGLSSMIINASDDGKFSQVPDTATAFFSSGPPPPDGACPVPFASSPVTQGEVVINNALP